ncbi:MAG: hypothetical protein WC699_16365 [Bacteroidales bacterium]|jgi:hypothetical protein
MKNYLILAMILIAGMTAYPQATRSARENKSEKGSARKEATQTRTRSESKSTSTVQRSKSSDSRQATGQGRVETRSAVRTQPARTNNESTRARVETRSTDRGQANRTTDRGQVTRSTDRGQVTRSTNESARRSEDQTRVRTGNDQRSGSGNAVRRTETNTVRPENRGTGVTSSATRRGETRNSDNAEVRVNTSSASRVYREGKGTLTTDDGRMIRHQNDEVFASRRYKLDFDNYENLRRSDDFRRDYRDYDNWYNHRRIRIVNHYHNRYMPLPWDIRRSRYYYRIPRHIDLIWTPLLFHRFMYYYPTHTNWEMEFGSQIETISANDAGQYAGTVRRVYGKVDEVYYSPEDENYILYIGAPFPYQDMSVVIPRNIARNISASPKWYFENEYVWVVGLINMWEGKPELIVRDEDQIRKY